MNVFLQNFMIREATGLKGPIIQGNMFSVTSMAEGLLLQGLLLHSPN